MLPTASRQPPPATSSSFRKVLPPASPCAIAETATAFSPSPAEFWAMRTIFEGPCIPLFNVLTRLSSNLGGTDHAQRAFGSCSFGLCFHDGRRAHGGEGASDGGPRRTEPFRWPTRGPSRFASTRPTSRPNRSLIPRSCPIAHKRFARRVSYLRLLHGRRYSEPCARVSETGVIRCCPSFAPGCSPTRTG